MIDSLIKQQTAWSQGSSKYQKQKKCTRSEILINLSFYVYIIPKETFGIFKCSLENFVHDLFYKQEI
jgi:hypothetical protein